MIKLYNFDELKPEEILNRDIRAEKNVEDVVDGIIADVRARGDEALEEYALKFDGAKLDNIQVTQEEIEEAFANMDGYFLETLREAAANIEAFHRQQVHKNFVMNDKPGIVLGQKYTPIEKAGVYVPGGTAAYPSTVLMDVIPAKVAGVSEIVMTTPAGKDGKIDPVILAAAATAGVTRIFKTGGAQAVAALAYGTQSIPAVDKIVGPGNIYVATAKRKVFGKVGIDMIAGPSEILVLADGGCDPAWVAADLLSQAEHDRLASPVLVTDSAELAKACLLYTSCRFLRPHLLPQCGQSGPCSGHLQGHQQKGKRRSDPDPRLCQGRRHRAGDRRELPLRGTGRTGYEDPCRRRHQASDARPLRKRKSGTKSRVM